MPFKLSRTSVLLITAIILGTILVQRIGTSKVSDEFLMMLVIGRIPGTEIFIGFESIAAGFLFGIWLAATYHFTIDAFIKINKEMKVSQSQQDQIEEVAL